jgi:RND family efflux transporter MFP subunit
MPVQVAPVVLSPEPTSDSYVATIKSRRSATMQPQVDGNLTRILVKSGDAVKAGQVLMTIDPLKQQATVQQQVGTENQLKATYQYNQAEVERQRKLFEAGVTSRDAYDQAMQSYQNSMGAYNSATAQTSTQREQLAYYNIRAPFDGIVGDVPVHQGDYVSPTTVLTTVDENSQLEAYIYLPTERAADIRTGLAVDILDTTGAVLTHSIVDFVSPQVDNGLQSVLAKAPIPAATHLRTGQLVNARIVFAVHQTPTVPVLAVTLVGGQTFVYIAAPKGGGFVAHQVAIKVADPVGNIYPVLDGLNLNDRVILSGIQFLQEGVPVQPLPPPPAGSAPKS